MFRLKSPSKHSPSNLIQLKPFKHIQTIQSISKTPRQIMKKSSPKSWTSLVLVRPKPSSRPRLCPGSSCRERWQGPCSFTAPIKRRSKPTSMPTAPRSAGPATPRKMRGMSTELDGTRGTTVGDPCVCIYIYISY